VLSEKYLKELEYLLKHFDLSRFSIENRLLWAANRQTSKEEDAAYCLLGVFGVFMPLIYGEGRANAFRQLRREIKESEKERIRQDKDQRFEPGFHADKNDIDGESIASTDIWDQVPPWNL
jgi:hypothetical protein